MKFEKGLSGIRREYSKQEFSEADLHLNPFYLFNKWLQEAINSKVLEPTAMSLATVDATGQPSNRIVLLKEITSEAICFFSNYDSKKGKQISENPKAALNFYWPELERQIRIEGVISKINSETSDNYFATRPYESQIGAWASKQSSPIPNREHLLDQFETIKKRYRSGVKVPRPNYWGGYQLKPHLFEFWQGRASRLHDRFQYVLDQDSWNIQRLAP